MDVWIDSYFTIMELKRNKEDYPRHVYYSAWMRVTKEIMSMRLNFIAKYKLFIYLVAEDLRIETCQMKLKS